MNLNKFEIRRQEAVEGKSYSAVLVFSGDFKQWCEDFFYLTGKRIDGSILILRKGKPSILLTSRMNVAEGKKAGMKTLIYDKKNPLERVGRYLKGIKNIGINYSFVSYAQYRKIRLKLRKKKILDCGRNILLQRMIKDREEIQKIRKAQRITRDIINWVGRLIYSGMREDEVKQRILKRTIEFGCTPAFLPIVASGTSSASPHYSGGKKRLSGVVLIDYGVRYEGYCGDMTRCFFLDECKKEREVYSKLQKISNEVIVNIKEGMEVRKLDLLHTKLMK
ncbi:MAG: M24 family metallopeptidase, partial [Candidatus Anstonellales archaeon]